MASLPCLPFPAVMLRIPRSTSNLVLLYDAESGTSCTIKFSLEFTPTVDIFGHYDFESAGWTKYDGPTPLPP